MLRILLLLTLFSSPVSAHRFMPGSNLVVVTSPLRGAGTRHSGGLYNGELGESS